jgi:hypothetical protein
MWLITTSCTSRISRCMHRRSQSLVFAQRAEMRVEPCEVPRPIAVIPAELIAAELGVFAPPAVRHRRCDPDRGCAQALNIAQPSFDAGQTATGKFTRVGGIGFVSALIAIAWVAIVEAIDHHQIDPHQVQHLIAPVCGRTAPLDPTRPMPPRPRIRSGRRPGRNHATGRRRAAFCDSRRGWVDGLDGMTATDGFMSAKVCRQVDKLRPSIAGNRHDGLPLTRPQPFRCMANKRFISFFLSRTA